MVTAIIQARLGSTRLPGKVLKEILGKPMLELMINRLKQSKTIDKIVIATTDNLEDEKIAGLAEKIGIDFYRGSETDVLDRYYQTAKKFKANDIVIRLTGDCPLIDSGVVDLVVDFFKKNRKKFDYVSNVRPPTFPDGIDTEVFSFETLEKAWRLAKLPSEREHVTAFIADHPEIFRIGNLKYNKDLSDMRLTVDNEEDFILIKKIFRLLYKKNKDFKLEDVLNLLEGRPELLLINRHIKRNEGYSKSLKK